MAWMPKPSFWRLCWILWTAYLITWMLGRGDAESVGEVIGVALLAAAGLTGSGSGVAGAMPHPRAAGLAVLAAQAVAAGEGLGDVQC